MEVKILVEIPVGTGVGEINRFVRLHGNENLDKSKETGEYALVGILFDLIIGLADIYAAALQLAVNQGHTVDQQHKVSATVGQNRTSCLEHRLLCNLIAALTGGNFLPVIDFQTDLFAKVQLVRRIVTLDRDGFAVDEAVEF